MSMGSIDRGLVQVFKCTRDLFSISSSSILLLEVLSLESRTGVSWELLNANDLSVTCTTNSLKECLSKLTVCKEGTEGTEGTGLTIATIPEVLDSPKNLLNSAGKTSEKKGF